MISIIVHYVNGNQTEGRYFSWHEFVMDVRALTKNPIFPIQKIRMWESGEEWSTGRNEPIVFEFKPKEA